jgi:spermidine/putrescine transport system permease protein
VTSSRNPLWRFPGLDWIIGFFFAFLYLPIFVLVALSFNRNDVATLWTGFSFDWYRVVLENDNIVRAARNSLIVASSATVISTFLALSAAIGMAGRSFRGQTLFNGLIGLPLLVPEIVTAVASLLFFLSLGFQLSLYTVIIAHVVFCTPFAYLPIRARLEGLDPRLQEAAADLYAGRWRTFTRVTLPLLVPGILSGAMLAFIISLDDFVITFFVAGAGATTLPVYIYGMIRTGITPEVNAVSTLLLVLSIVVVTLSYLIGRRGSREDA